jgi:hypothetical protein
MSGGLEKCIKILAGEPERNIYIGILGLGRSILLKCVNRMSLPKGYHLDVVGGPSTPHDPESDAGGRLSSWQGHPSR